MGNTLHLTPKGLALRQGIDAIVSEMLQEVEHNGEIMIDNRGGEVLACKRHIEGLRERAGIPHQAIYDGILYQLNEQPQTLESLIFELMQDGPDEDVNFTEEQITFAVGVLIGKGLIE